LWALTAPLLLALDKLPDKDGLIMQAQQKARPTQLLYRYSYLNEERAGEAIRNSCAMGWIAARRRSPAAMHAGK
jgi:hypothetical protein